MGGGGGGGGGYIPGGAVIFGRGSETFLVMYWGWGGAGG